MTNGMKLALVSAGTAIVVSVITTFGAIWINGNELKKAQLAADEALLGANNAQASVVATGKEVRLLQESLKLENSGRKTCGAHHDTFIDTIVVPQSWSATTCESWSSGSSGGYHLGCIFPDSVSINRNGKGAPVPNCGW